MSRSAADHSGTTSFRCGSVVDENLDTVDWPSIQLVFVVLDVLLLVHRLTRLYVELDWMRSAAVVARSSPQSDGCAAAEDISVLPVDGVDPADVISRHHPVISHVGNHVHVEADDDDEADIGSGSTSNSLYAVSEPRSNSVGGATSKRRCATGSRWARRRRTRSSSPDIVPHLVFLVALLAALLYARATTMSRGVLWFRGALPANEHNSPSISTSAFGRHFYDVVSIVSSSDDFRQLQAFVDFFNRGKSMMIFRIVSMLIMHNQ